MAEKKRWSAPRHLKPAVSSRAAAKRSKLPKNRPSQPALPGTEAVRDTVLDALFETIGNCRADINDARKDEQEAIRKALQHMTEKGFSIYKHANVEGARMPGADKLR